MCRLRFGAVDHYAEVWLNGRRLGEHEGADAPLELDATAAVRPGKNLLAVRVINPGTRLSMASRSTRCHTPSSRAIISCSAGTPTPAVCCCQSNCSLGRPFGSAASTVGRNLPQGKLRCDCRSRTTFHRMLRVRWRLRSSVKMRAESAVVCSAGAELVAVPRTSEFALLLVVPRPSRGRRSARISIGLRRGCKPSRRKAKPSTCAGSGSDSAISVWDPDGYFYLNGRRLFLKSCHTVNNFPVAIGTAHQPDMFTRDLFYAKAMGFDIVRFLGGPPLPEQLRFCDEIGLMVYAEPRASWCSGNSPGWPSGSIGRCRR